MSDPKPATVRLYGVLPMTRRRYVFQLVFAGMLAAAMLVAWWLAWPRARADMAQVPGANTALLIRVMDWAPLLIVAGALLQALEARYVLGLFARKEKSSA